MSSGGVFGHSADATGAPGASVAGWAEPAQEIHKDDVAPVYWSQPGTAGDASPRPMSMLDDHLLAQLPSQVSQVLLAAKAASDAIIREAMERAARLEHQSRVTCLEASKQAERETQELLARARRASEDFVAEARRESERMLARAQAARDAMWAEFVSHRTKMELELVTRQSELDELGEERAALAGVASKEMSQSGDDGPISQGPQERREMAPPVVGHRNSYSPPSAQ